MCCKCMQSGALKLTVDCIFSPLKIETANGMQFRAICRRHMNFNFNFKIMQSFICPMVYVSNVIEYIISVYTHVSLRSRQIFKQTNLHFVYFTKM